MSITRSGFRPKSAAPSSGYMRDCQGNALVALPEGPERGWLLEAKREIREQEARSARPASARPSTSKKEDGSSSRPSTREAAPEVWNGLREYADSLRSAKDESGATVVAFPSNYDEVVGLMGRSELDASAWASEALREGVTRECSSRGDLSRYRGLFEKELDEERLAAGLAKIQQLDRKLRQRQARARAVADQLASVAVSPCTPSTARSLSSDTSYIFKLTEKRPRNTPPRVDYVETNAVVPRERSLLNHDQSMRAAELQLQADGDQEDDTARQLKAAPLPSKADAARLRTIDKQLKEMGHADLCYFDRDDPQCDNASRTGTFTDDSDPLASGRAERARRRLDHDLDLRLAVARNAPLLLLDDDEVEEHESRADSSVSGGASTAVSVSDVAALVKTLSSAETALDSPARAQRRAQVDEIVASMRDQIDTAATVRAQRRRRRKVRSESNTSDVAPEADRPLPENPSDDDADDDDDGATGRGRLDSARPDSASSSSRYASSLAPHFKGHRTASKQTQNRRVKKKNALSSFRSISCALHEASLKTTTALARADAALRSASLTLTKPPTDPAF